MGPLYIGGISVQLLRQFLSLFGTNPGQKQGFNLEPI